MPGMSSTGAWRAVHTTQGSAAAEIRTLCCYPTTRKGPGG